MTCGARVFHGGDLRKGRVSIPEQVYLLTTATVHRKPVFADPALGRCVVHALQRAESTGEARTLAFVVMPDHLHWLVGLGSEARLGSIVRSVKSGAAMLVNAKLDRRGSAVWQRGYHDHALRREEDVQGVARYIVCNPLRAGLVRRLGDYPLWDAVWL